MDEKELQALYNAMSKQFNVGNFDAFKNKMQTPEQRKSFYDAVGKNGYDLGDYNSYEQRIAGVKKKEPSSASNGIGTKIGAALGTGVVQSSKSLSDVGSSASSTERGLSIAGNTTGEVAPKKRIYDFDANDPYGKIGSQIDEDVQKEKDKPINYTSINNIGRFQGYKDKSIESR